MNVNLLEKPGVASWDPRIVCTLALMLVFFTGAAVGALVMDLGIHNRQHPRPPAFDTPTGKAIYFEKLRKDLDLTPEQSVQMESVLNDFWQYYRAVLGDGRSKVEQLLTPAQRLKFERILAEQQKQVVP
jgi:hypothetical protein